MDRKVVEQYLKQIVKIRLKNTWKYVGELVYVDDKSVILFDRIIGKTALDLDSLMSIEKFENGKNNK